MIRNKKSLLITLISLMLLALPAAALANGQSRLRLDVGQPAWAVGQEFTVEVWAEDVPLIYGADVQLTYDPALLEVVDADPGQEKTQVISGSFINADKSAFLEYNVDNQAGQIDYALALLNPAPPVDGEGVLVQVTFRPIAPGQAAIAITEGLFANQQGEEFSPSLDTLEVNITAAGQSPAVASEPGQPVDVAAPEAGDSAGAAPPPAPEQAAPVRFSVSDQDAGNSTAWLVGLVASSGACLLVLGLGTMAVIGGGVFMMRRRKASQY